MQLVLDIDWSINIPAYDNCRLDAKAKQRNLKDK